MDIEDLCGGRGGLSSSPLPFTANPVCTFTLEGGGARLYSLRGVAATPAPVGCLRPRPSFGVVRPWAQAPIRDTLSVAGGCLVPHLFCKAGFG